MTNLAANVGDRVIVISEFTDATEYSSMNGKQGVVVSVDGRDMYPYYVELDDYEGSDSVYSVMKLDGLVNQDETVSKAELLEFLNGLVEAGQVTTGSFMYTSITEQFKLVPKKKVSITLELELDYDQPRLLNALAEELDSWSGVAVTNKLLEEM